MNLHTFNSKSPFSTFHLENKDGREWIVSKGVPIVEGVLNGMLASMDEFGLFVKDWDGVPLVLRHPKQNNGSARVPNPDVPVIGRFFGAALDPQGRRMTGEYWFDKASLLSFDEGKRLHDDLLAGKMLETSTGYYANIDNTPGQYLGLSYTGIQHEIHPDHIAILPDEIGACSLRDGCGVNRNSMEASMDLTQNGGAGSGNYGHKGRPGERGGSDGDGVSGKDGKEFADSSHPNVRYFLDRSEYITKKGDQLYYEEDRGRYVLRLTNENKLGVTFYGEDKAMDKSNEFDITEDDYYLLFTRRQASKSMQTNVTGNLPAEGKKLWEKVYEESKSGGDDEETAAKKAWGACKEAGWKQDKDEKWVQDNVSCADGFDEEIGIFSNGGSGSGNFGHKGRSGEVGGSAKDGDSETGNSLLDSVRKRMKGTSQWTKKKREEVIKMMMKRGDEWTGQTMDDLEARAKEYNDDLFARFGKENVMKGLYPDEFKEFEKDISAYREMLYDARMRSFKNAQAPSQDYHWLVRLFSKSKQEKHTMDMNQELVTKILNEAGYTVNFVDGKNVTATPSAAHLSETLTGLESIVNEMGGTAKFKEMLLNVGKFPTCIQNLTDTLNEVKGNVQAATVMAQNAAAKAEAEKKDFVARLIANAQCPFNEEELNAMALNALQKLEASYRPTNYAALGAGQFVDVANAAADDILGVPSLFQE